MDAKTFKDIAKVKIGGNVSANKYDHKIQKVVCFFDDINAYSPAFKGATKTQETNLRVVFHGTKSYQETQDWAREAFEHILESRYENDSICYILPSARAPFSVSTDENGIYESIINLTVYSA